MPEKHFGIFGLNAKAVEVKNSGGLFICVADHYSYVKNIVKGQSMVKNSENGNLSRVPARRAPWVKYSEPMTRPETRV